MKKNQHCDEKIVKILRDAAARQNGVTKATIYRWRKLYDGMQVADVKELKALRDENARLPTIQSH